MSDHQNPRSPKIFAPVGVVCPQCTSPMVLRVSRQGPTPGVHFFGCVKFPVCYGTRSIEDVKG
ncbi:topoisomerase DNA-binding C4 zinc finger domain-containing protein [Paraburkholderia denitrificans]|uniref:Topoisomerase DNA-binding C4 zinc finger domain-containing protein n=1 Tax=Paraburkholderia denitrificans TaxID=694025 RepID=A0ABW0J3F0_9BURK